MATNDDDKDQQQSQQTDEPQGMTEGEVRAIVSDSGIQQMAGSHEQSLVEGIQSGDINPDDIKLQDNTGDQGAVGGVPSDLDSMTKEQIQQYADSNNIDGVNQNNQTKDEMIQTIRDAQRG